MVGGRAEAESLVALVVGDGNLSQGGEGEKQLPESKALKAESAGLCVLVRGSQEWFLASQLAVVANVCEPSILEAEQEDCEFKVMGLGYITRTCLAHMHMHIHIHTKRMISQSLARKVGWVALLLITVRLTVGGCCLERK
jgi:hypothetical protein